MLSRWGRPNPAHYWGMIHLKLGFISLTHIKTGLLRLNWGWCMGRNYLFKGTLQQSHYYMSQLLNCMLCCNYESYQILVRRINVSQDI